MSGLALPFDGQAVSSSDVLVKYTYYGDANLDGKVDGTDYSRLDNAIMHPATGWFNGDFNYDGTTDGSDFTLLDNAFNSQGASLAATIAVLQQGSYRVMDPTIVQPSTVQTSGQATSDNADTDATNKKKPRMYIRGSVGHDIKDLDLAEATQSHAQPAA
jgi:hypothetical protein